MQAQTHDEVQQQQDTAEGGKDEGAIWGHDGELLRLAVAGRSATALGVWCEACRVRPVVQGRFCKTCCADLLCKTCCFVQDESYR
ncbi:hypothetical protein HHA02_33120 [Cobetia marina]|nr:hypothetical protein HHA02_33120 [Cobetia marina]